MSNPVGPGNVDDTTEDIVIDPTAEPATEIIGSPTEITDAVEQVPERLFTAPSSYDDATIRIERPADLPTRAFAPPHANETGPQRIPTPDEIEAQPPRRRSWGWVLAVILVIAALAAVAVLATVLLTRNSTSGAAAPDDQQSSSVRAAVLSFDDAIQDGDLTALRNLTCGLTHDNYVGWDEQAWEDTQAKLAAAKTYQVVSSVDWIVVTGDHAQATVTTHRAASPDATSTRNYGLERDSGQWKICPAPIG